MNSMVGQAEVRERARVSLTVTFASAVDGFGAGAYGH